MLLVFYWQQNCYLLNRLKHTILSNEILQHLEALIIDDEKDICFLHGSLLKKRNIRSKFVNTLRDAANLLELNEPEVIFLDNHLPDGMGLNFIGYIKRFHPLTKIVMITAYDTIMDKQRAFKEGVDYAVHANFLVEIRNLKTIRNSLAHTYLKGPVATMNIDSPARTMARFSYIYEGLKAFEQRLKAL